MVRAGWIALLTLLTASAAVRAGAASLDEALYAGILRRHTRAVEDTAGTRVDYRALARSADWKRLIRSLEQADPEALATRDEKLAFWINSYNILAIAVVLSRYPVESIKDVGSLFRPVWKRRAGTIDGRPYTLGQIEHEILRPMGEPRIHMAIVCASTSCPSLRREPFTAARLDGQLDDSTRRFLADRDKGLRVLGPDAIQISRIFDWFEQDFEPGGGVLDFVRRHAPEPGRIPPDADVDYFDYDWSLNDIR
jgi:hypothetical protein